MFTFPAILGVKWLQICICYPPYLIVFSHAFTVTFNCYALWSELLRSLTLSRSTSSASFMFLVWICKISSRPVESGIPMSISRSNLPGERVPHYQSHVPKVFIKTPKCVWCPYVCVSDQSVSELGPHCLVCLLLPWQPHELFASGRPWESVAGRLYASPLHHGSRCMHAHTQKVTLPVWRRNSHFVFALHHLPSLSWERWHPAHR